MSSAPSPHSISAGAIGGALDSRGAYAGEVAGEGLRAVGRLPRGLVDHAAHEGDLVREGRGPGEGEKFISLVVGPRTEKRRPDRSVRTRRSRYSVRRLGGCAVLPGVANASGWQLGYGNDWFKGELRRLKITHAPELRKESAGARQVK